MSSMKTLKWIPVAGLALTNHERESNLKYGKHYMANII